MHAILHKHGIICLERADLNLKRLIYTHDILYDHEKDIRIIPQWITNDISSTKIRCVLFTCRFVSQLTANLNAASAFTVGYRSSICSPIRSSSTYMSTGYLTSSRGKGNQPLHPSALPSNSSTSAHL